MVSNARIGVQHIFSSSEERTYFSPATDGGDNVAVISGPGADNFDWPRSLMHIRYERSIELVEFSQKLRAIVWDGKQGFWISTFSGLGRWTRDKSMVIIFEKLPSGKLFLTGDGSVALVPAQSTEVFFIQRLGKDFACEKHAFDNPTRMHTHGPQACLLGPEGFGFCLEHGLIQLKDGGEFKMPNATPNLGCSQLWYSDGKVYSLSEPAQKTNRVELSVAQHPAGNNYWSRTFNEAITVAHLSDALKFFLYARSDSPKILRGLRTDTGKNVLELNPDIGKLHALVDVAGSLWCFGSTGIAKLHAET